MQCLSKGFVALFKKEKQQQMRWMENEQIADSVGFRQQAGGNLKEHFKHIYSVFLPPSIGRFPNL